MKSADQLALKLTDFVIAHRWWVLLVALLITVLAALSEGGADLISFGIPFLANPDLPKRFSDVFELNTPDPKTFYVGGEKGYIDYPSLAG